MGKIRVKTIGDEGQEEEQKKKAEVKREQKRAREASVEEVSESEQPPQPQSPQLEPVESGQPQGAQAEPKTEVKPKKAKKSKFVKAKARSANYSAKIMEIDKNKIYSLPEALELLKKVHLAKFDETVELHINTNEPGISGTVKLPHGSGKELRIAVANDDVLGQIEGGKINFDILIAAPSMMPKLAKVAKFLGPKGLMPNPKNGTISDNPEEAAKKFAGGLVSFKTESKIPVMHLTVGKMSFGDDKLSENIQTIIGAIKKDRIQKVVLKSTMSPAIKLQV